MRTLACLLVWILVPISATAQETPVPAPSPPSAPPLPVEPKEPPPAETGAAHSAPEVRLKEFNKAKDSEGRAALVQKYSDLLSARAAVAKAETVPETEATAAERAAKLLEVGLTIGAAEVITFPIEDRSAQEEAVLTIMPYVMAVPAYWGYRPEKRRYCASVFSGDEHLGHQAAVSTARQWARRVVGTLLLSAANGAKEDELIEMLKKVVDGEAADKQLERLAQALQKAVLLAGDDRAIEHVIGELATLKWNAGDTTGCGWARLGLWVGLPGDYEVKSLTSPDETSATKRDFDTVISLGLAFVPNAYVSILGGATYGKFKSGDATDDELVLTLGLGGNADIVQALFKL